MSATWNSCTWHFRKQKEQRSHYPRGFLMIISMSPMFPSDTMLHLILYSLPVPRKYVEARSYFCFHTAHSSVGIQSVLLSSTVHRLFSLCMVSLPRHFVSRLSSDALSIAKGRLHKVTRKKNKMWGRKLQWPNPMYHSGKNLPLLISLWAWQPMVGLYSSKGAC